VRAAWKDLALYLLLNAEPQNARRNLFIHREILANEKVSSCPRQEKKIDTFAA
jgi:hypothetical protein